MGYTTTYDPGETVVYMWAIHNKQGNLLSPLTGEFTLRHSGLYILSFYGAISPYSPNWKDIYASMMVGKEEVAYVYASYGSGGQMQTGSMLVLRRMAKGTKDCVRNDRRKSFGFTVVFITE